MDLLFIASVVAISATGALSPGPLSAATLALGVRSGWKSGFLVAVGHTLFELPYVILLATLYNSLVTFIQQQTVKYALSVVIAAFNTFFAYLLVIDALKYSSGTTSSNSKSFTRFRNPLIVGLMLTGLNPFFLVWWATVGMPLINNAIKYGLLLGIPIMYLFHVWLDYAWLSFLAYTTYSGGRYIGLTGYKILLITLAFVLILFAINALMTAFLNHPLIPI